MAAADAASVISSSIASLSIANGSYTTNISASSSSLPIIPTTSYGVNYHSPSRIRNNSTTKFTSPQRRKPWQIDDQNHHHQQRHQHHHQQQQQQQQQFYHESTIRMIQVTDVLTGGYAIDALTKGTSHTHHTPRRSNANGSVVEPPPNCNTNSTTSKKSLSSSDSMLHCDNTTITSISEDNHSNNNVNVYSIIPGGIDRGGLKNEGKLVRFGVGKGNGRIKPQPLDNESAEGCDDEKVDHHGYLFRGRNGIPIAEEIPSPPLLCQPGPFFYRVVSTIPLPILAGPCADAPLTRAMALPGTVHEISLRMGSVHGNGIGGGSNNSSPLNSPGRSGVGGTGLEDGIVYLRSSHRRGWIANRRYVLLPLSSPYHDTAPSSPQRSPRNSPRNSPNTTRGHRRNNSGGSYSATSQRTCIELVMKEVSDYVDVSNFGISDDVSLGGTSISSASVSTPISILRTRRRSIRRRNERGRRRGYETRNGVSVFPMANLQGKVEMKAGKNFGNGLEASPISDLSLHSGLSNRNQRTTNSYHQLTSHAPSDGHLTTHSEVNFDGPKELKPNVFLLRVVAPNGLKILDAPHFQVNNLIRGQGGTATMPVMKTYKSTSSEVSVSKSVASASTINPSAIFHTMNGSLHTDYGRACSWELDASGRKRILPRGVLFEASSRMERSGTFSHGSGLIKLSDGSGWAIIPSKEELLEQYATFQNGAQSIDAETSKGFEEVGNAIVLKDHQQSNPRCNFEASWIRVVQATGVLVSCAPVSQKKEDNRSKRSSPISNTYSSDSSHSKGSVQHETDAASTVSGVFGAFRPAKKHDVKVDIMSVASASRNRQWKKNTINLIPCGTCVQVEPSIPSTSYPEKQVIPTNVYMYFLLYPSFCSNFLYMYIIFTLLSLSELCTAMWRSGMDSPCFPGNSVFN